MLNREFIDSSDDVKKIVAEQNEITVLDESIPSPAEIQTDETIVLPEIISMPEYIRRHYAKELIRACINQIYDLMLCMVYDGKLFHGVPGLRPIDSGEKEMILTDGPTPLEWGEPKSFPFDRNVYSATIRPMDGAITWMDFYRLSDCCVEAELTIEIQLYYRYGSQGAYEAHTVCEKRGYVLEVEITPGNVHDSVAFDTVFERLIEHYPEVEVVTADAGYSNSRTF